MLRLSASFRAHSLADRSIGLNSRAHLHLINGPESRTADACVDLLGVDQQLSCPRLNRAHCFNRVQDHVQDDPLKLNAIPLNGNQTVRKPRVNRDAIPDDHASRQYNHLFYCRIRSKRSLHEPSSDNFRHKPPLRTSGKRRWVQRTELPLMAREPPASPQHCRKGRDSINSDFKMSWSFWLGMQTSNLVAQPSSAVASIDNIILLLLS